jgi:sulfide dehydrogenase cytochrome subunit
MLLITILALSSAPALAAGPSATLLAGTCATCHGIDGRNAGSVPTIATMDAASLREALQAFKKDERKGTIMNRIAKGYSDKEIEAVARYLGSRK